MEEFFNFQGILIELQDDFFNNITKNRSVIKNEVYNCAVTINDATAITFIGNNAEGCVLNDRNTDLGKYNWKPYTVANKQMKDILHNSKFNYIDFMITDVEGSELSLLKSINFVFPIFCIIIEAHSGEQEKNKMDLNLKKDSAVMKYG